MRLPKYFHSFSNPTSLSRNVWGDGLQSQYYSVKDFRVGRKMKRWKDIFQSIIGGLIVAAAAVLAGLVDLVDLLYHLSSGR